MSNKSNNGQPRAIRPPASAVDLSVVQDLNTQRANMVAAYELVGDATVTVDLSSGTTKTLTGRGAGFQLTERGDLLVTELPDPTRLATPWGGALAIIAAGQWTSATVQQHPASGDVSNHSASAAISDLA